jgi:hypothetical protein
MNEQTLVNYLTEAMEGVEQAREGYLRAAKALHELGIDRNLHRDVALAMDEARDFQARLTEHVPARMDGGH